MATAKRIPPPQSDPYFELTLSKEEAETLFYIVGFTTLGSSENSPRKHTDAIYDALKNAGVERRHLNSEGVVFFK